MFRALVGAFLALFIGSLQVVRAEPPSHDPSTMVKNTDGRYWIYTTGNGIWSMSASNTSFSDWKADKTVFTPGTWRNAASMPQKHPAPKVAFSVMIASRSLDSFPTP